MGPRGDLALVSFILNPMSLTDMDDRPKPPKSTPPEPVSSRIRARIQRAKKRFHANDNIAAFLQPGELEELLTEVESKFKGVLESLVIDTESDHNTQDTARRVAKMYLTEVFRGRYVEPPAVTRATKTSSDPESAARADMPGRNASA